MARVLIVDDDEGIREVLRDLLDEAGYAVAEAEDGAAGLAMLRASPEPLVVLLDYRMPEMDGGAVLRAVAEEGLDTRHAYALLLASPHLLDRDPDVQIQANRAHIPVVPKPFDMDTLLCLVATLAAQLEPASR
jgi:CheY-like chemotaxis protein